MPRQTNTDIGPLRRQKLVFYMSFADYFLYVNRQIGINDFTGPNESIPLNFNSRSVINEERRRVAREKAQQMLQMLQEVEPKQLRATYGSTYLGLSPSWGSIFLNTSPAAISIAGTDRDPFREKISEMGSGPLQMLYEFKEGVAAIELLLREEPQQDITGAFSMLQKWNTLKNALETMPYANSRKLIPMLWATLHYAVIDAKNLGEREIPNLRIPQNTGYFYWDFSNSVFPAVKNWVKQYAVTAQGVGEMRAEAPVEAPAEVTAERVALNLTPPPPFDLETWQRRNQAFQIEESRYERHLPVLYRVQNSQNYRFFNAIPSAYVFPRPYVLDFTQIINYLQETSSKTFEYQNNGRETNFNELYSYYESKKGRALPNLVEYDDVASLLRQMRRTTAQEAMNGLNEPLMNDDGGLALLTDFTEKWVMSCAKILFNVGAMDQWSDGVASQIPRLGIIDIESARIQTLWDGNFDLKQKRTTKTISRFGVPYFAYASEGEMLDNGFPGFTEGFYQSSAELDLTQSVSVANGNGEMQKDVVFAELIAKDASMLFNALIDKDIRLIKENAKEFNTKADGGPNQDDIIGIEAFWREDKSRTGLADKIMAPNCMMANKICSEIQTKMWELQVYCQTLNYTQKAYLLHYFWNLDVFSENVKDKSEFFKNHIVTAIYGIDKAHIDVLQDGIDGANNMAKLQFGFIDKKITKGFVKVLYDCISALLFIDSKNYVNEIAKKRRTYEERLISSTSAQIGMQMYGVYSIYKIQKLNYEALTIAIQNYFLEKNDKASQYRTTQELTESIGDFLYFLGNIAHTSIAAKGVNQIAKEMHQKIEVYLNNKLFETYLVINPIADIIENVISEVSKEAGSFAISNEFLQHNATEYIAPMFFEGSNERRDDLGQINHTYISLSLAASEFHFAPNIETNIGLLPRNNLSLHEVIWCKPSYDMTGLPNLPAEEQLRMTGSLDEVMERVSVMAPSCSFGLEFEGVKNDIQKKRNPLYVEGSRDPETANEYITTYAQLAEMFVERGVAAREGQWGDSDYTTLQVKPDGSVYIPRGGTNFEMVFAPYIGQAALDNCQKTLEAMLDMGCRVHGTAGYHIHVQVVGTSSSDDPNNELNAEQRKNLIWNFACMEPWMFETMTPIHRRRSAKEWAKPLAQLLKERMGRFNRAETPLEIRNALDTGPRSRYFALNIFAETTKPTYEFRFPHSNFEYQSANNLMLVIDKLYQFSKVARFPPKGDLQLEKLLGTALWTYWMNIGLEYADPDVVQRNDFANDAVYERLKTLRFEF